METWRAIPGHEGWYEASSEGRVRAVQRPIRGGARCFREAYPLILTPLAYKKGYFKIQLGRCNGTRAKRREYLHRIIYRTFVGPIPSNRSINHVDGDKGNNRLANLELATPRQQIDHARAHRLNRWRTKAGHSRPRLTLGDVREIRRAYAAGDTTYETLAARFGVVKATVGHILQRRTWRHVA